MSYQSPYNVYEAEVGKYNPDNPPPRPPFSVWMSERKSEYLTEFPEAAKNQIDGHFFDPELKRFFQWISERRTKQIKKEKNNDSKT